jgi:hypothetical protein
VKTKEVSAKYGVNIGKGGTIMYHLMRGVMTPPAASTPSERGVTSRRSWVVLFLTTNTDGVGVTDELGLFTLAADSSC